MKNWVLLTFLTLFSLNAFANTESVLEEKIYLDFQEKILSQSKTSTKSLNGFSAFEQGLFVDALWDLVEADSEVALKTLDEMHTFHYTLFERLRLQILKVKYQRQSMLDEAFTFELRNALTDPAVEIKIIYTIAAYEALLTESGHHDIIHLAQQHPKYQDISQDSTSLDEYSDDMVSDIFHKSPDLTDFMDGKYQSALKVFMFCRSNRLFPCLMTMRDSNGEVVRNEDGSIWTHQSLGSSRLGLPSHIRNGNTPAGVWTIDSVMPVADQQLSYGKNRRLMLNFIPKSKNEQLLQKLLPESSFNESWWRPTVVARDVGRNLFRVHGTLKINEDINSPFYPFMQTIGCIAQKENKYGDITYNDQRILLDTMMTSMGLAPVYANEVKIKAVLYLVEIDNEEAPVSIDDLIQKGIE